MTAAKKKKLTITLSVCLVLITVIGITLALLTATSGDKVNEFTVLGSDDIDYDIDEPGWPDDGGEGMIPNVPIPKDPYGINLSSDISIWAAMQVVIVKGADATEFDPDEVLSEDQYELLMEYLYLRYDTAQTATNYNSSADTGKDPDTEGVWIEAGQVETHGNGKIFIWSEALKPVGDDPENKTDTLFEDVMLAYETDNDILDWINGKADYEKADGTTVDKLDNFSIIIRGAAVQHEGVSRAEATASLVSMLQY